MDSATQALAGLQPKTAYRRWGIAPRPENVCRQAKDRATKMIVGRCARRQSHFGCVADRHRGNSRKRYWRRLCHKAVTAMASTSVTTGSAGWCSRHAGPCMAMACSCICCGARQLCPVCSAKLRPPEAASTPRTGEVWISSWPLVQRSSAPAAKSRVSDWPQDMVWGLGVSDIRCLSKSGTPTGQCLVLTGGATGTALLFSSRSSATGGELLWLLGCKSVSVAEQMAGA
jgi:hypothetical protein